MIIIIFVAKVMTMMMVERGNTAAASSQLLKFHILKMFNDLIDSGSDDTDRSDDIVLTMMMLERGNTAAGSAQLLKLPARRQFSSFALLSAPSGGDDHGQDEDKGSPPFRI